jgi:hypothetical protein
MWDFVDVVQTIETAVVDKSDCGMAMKKESEAQYFVYLRQITWRHSLMGRDWWR